MCVCKREREGERVCARKRWLGRKARLLGKQKGVSKKYCVKISLAFPAEGVYTFLKQFKHGHSPELNELHCNAFDFYIGQNEHHCCALQWLLADPFLVLILRHIIPVKGPSSFYTLTEVKENSDKCDLCLQTAEHY